MGLIRRALIVAGVAFAALGGVIPGGAEGASTATLYVDNTNASATDSGNDCQTQSTPCATISHAVSLANGMGSTATTIDVLAGAYDEAVTITDEPSTSTLTIIGGAGVTVTAPVGDSIFTATSDTFPTGKITLSDLTITGAQAAGSGGGLQDNSAGVNLVNDTFSNDSAASGGAVDTEGGNEIVGVTFVDDSASNSGGAISNGGSFTATNDTFVNDTAGGDGGAISTETGATIENDTFAGDTAASGGALYNDFDATIAADIFDDGSGTGSNCVDGPINGGSGVTDAGYNVADNSDCGMSAGNHDIVNAPETGTGGINHGSLADNGGPTQTMALGSDSAAIDYVPISTGLCPRTDQRGFLRPDDGESACDVGAYESGSGPPVTLTVGTAGSGSGTVTSSPAGIECGSTCSTSYSEGMVVTLTATPAAGSTFTGWSGGGCSGTGACQVTMSAAESVTATFDVVPTDTLAVSKLGHGLGVGHEQPGGDRLWFDVLHLVQRGHGRDVNRDPRRRLDLHRLVRRGLLRYRRLSGDDERRRIGNRDVHDDHRQAGHLDVRHRLGIGREFPARDRLWFDLLHIVQRGHGRDANRDPRPRLDVQRLVRWGLLGHRRLPGDARLRHDRHGDVHALAGAAGQPNGRPGGQRRRDSD